MSTPPPSPPPPPTPPHPPFPPTPPAPPADLLAELYRQLPMLVVHLTADGIVLHCNPETVRVTGYLTGELVGKNFWATLFPGRLFAQVPKFIPASWSGMGGEGGGAAGGDGAAGVWGGPPPLMRDRPMTIRTRSGEERVVAFTRFEAARNGAACGWRRSA